MATAAANTELQNGRPAVFEVRDAFCGIVGYGVRVRLGNETREVTTFQSSEDAYAKGVDVLADMIDGVW